MAGRAHHNLVLTGFKGGKNGQKSPRSETFTALGPPVVWFSGKTSARTFFLSHTRP
jgi:hypothetical protein